MIRSLQLPTREFTVDDIKINEEGFRNARTNLEDLNSLSDAIETQKMLSVPVVWEKQDENGDMSFILLAGHRRVAAWKALREKLIEAGEEIDSTIVCTVFQGTLEEALGANITENIERVALSFTDKIQGIAKLAERFKDDGQGNDVQKRVADLVGCSQPTVSNYIRLYANLIRESFEALKEGAINQKQAKALSRLNPEDQLTQLEAFLGAGEDVIPEERKSPRRERTFRAKREFEELRSLLAKIESDEDIVMDVERRKVILDVLRWASKELDRDQLLYGLVETDIVIEETEEPEETLKKKRIRIGE